MRKFITNIIIAILIFIVYVILLRSNFIGVYMNFIGIKTSKILEIIPLILMIIVICIFHGRSIKEKLCNFLTIFVLSYFMIILFVVISFMITMYNFD